MQHISSKELKEKIAASEEFLLLDVREDWEHESFNIGGQHIPLGDIMQNADKIPTDKPVVVYCKKGVRSQLAIQRLQQKFGFTNLINLDGGLTEWKLLDKT